MSTNDQYIVGVDLGGTSINVGVVPFDGSSVIGLRSMPTEPDRGAKFVVDRMIEMIKVCMSEAQAEAKIPDSGYVGIGLGAPGPLDRTTGTVIESPNLGWRNFPLRDLIANSIGLEAALDNDANAAALGEWWVGAGRNVDTLVGITLGTGIGGGIVLGGRVYHGTSGIAGEIGHTTIDSSGRKCKCGNYGCLEAYASGPAIAARAIEGIESGEVSILTDLAGGAIGKITAETVFEAIVEGDDYAQEVMRDTAHILGIGIANVINVLNPAMVVISGGVTRAGDYLFEPLRREVLKRAFRNAAENCRIVSSDLGVRAGVLGAAYTFKIERLGET